MPNIKNNFNIHKSVFVAPNATLIGNCNIGEDSSIWFGAVLRGDNDLITIGKYSNIQDLCVIHVDPKKPVIIGNHCTIGHRAIVHGCVIGNNVLVGMGAILMNNCVIGDNCIIGAGALVTEHTIIPANSMVIGMPAKVKRALTENEVKAIENNAAVYCVQAKKYIFNEK